MSKLQAGREREGGDGGRGNECVRERASERASGREGKGLAGVADHYSRIGAPMLYAAIHSYLVPASTRGKGADSAEVRRSAAQPRNSTEYEIIMLVLRQILCVTFIL